MNKFKEWFQMKRILTFVLAVAMVVTMLPTTALAAEMPEMNLEQNEEVAVEEVSEATEDAMLETTEIETVEETFAETAEVTEEEAALVTVLTMELEEEDKTAVYTGYDVFASLSYFKNQVKVTVDGEDVIPAEEDLTLTWKKVGADGALADLPENTTGPVDAGTYKMLVKLAAREGQYKEAEMDGGVEFTITPAKVYVTPDTEPSLNAVKPGTKVGDIKVSDARVFVEAGNTIFNYVVDDPATKDVDESKESDIAITVSVRDVFDTEKTPLAADTVLAANGDYTADFAVSFTEKGKTAAAGNYEVAEAASQDVSMSDLITSYVNVTLADAWKEEGRITYTYTGKEAAAPVNGKDFTAKVQYADGLDEEGNVTYADIADAEIVEEWYELIGEKEYTDAEGHVQVVWEWEKMETAPVNAGSYVYRLSYAGQDGFYAAASKDIEVVIKPMPVVLVPELKADAVFYDEMTEADVLSQVDYSVFSPEDMENAISVDKNTVWGTSYSSVSKTQPYEPVFVLEYEGENEEGQLTYLENAGAALDSTKKYRIIFDGTKAVSYASGVISDRIPINDVVNTTALNYQVVADYASVSANALEPVKVEKGVETAIDISVIVEGLDGKGESLDTPYVTVYDRTSLYQKKEDYKLAVVKADDKVIAKETEAAIEYKWYVNENESITDYIFSEYNEPYAEGEENTFDKEWSLLSGDGYSIPWEAGVYKLEITYKDEEKPEYLGSSASVYYVIEKQPLKVALNGEYKAFIGQSISEFFKKFYQEQQDTVSVQMLSDFTISGNTVSGNEWIDMDTSLLGEEGEDWYISYEVLETSLVPKTDETGAEIMDAEGNPVLIPQTIPVYHWCEKDGESYPALDANGSQLMENVEYTIWSDTVIREDAEYKLTAALHIDNDYNTYDNYTDTPFVVKDYIIKKPQAESTEVHKVRETKSYNDKVAIVLEKMGTTALSVSVNEAALGDAQKVYDGKPFDISAFLKDAVSIVKGDGSVVTDVAVNYTWNGDKWNEYDEEFYYERGFDQAIDAGEYDLYAEFAGNADYAPISRVKIATVTITPAKITLTPAMTTEVVAGTYSEDLWINDKFQQRLVFEGVAEADKDAFTYFGGFEAFTEELENRENGWYDYINFDICDEDGNYVEFAETLKGEKTYTIQANDTLIQPYDNNYEIEYKEVSFKTVRGISRIASVRQNLTYEYFTNELKDETPYTSINVTSDGYHHTIVPVNAIPYSYYIGEDGDKVYGNFLEVKIYVPGEYDNRMPSTALYKNAIEAQGGVITNEDPWNGRFNVILDAAETDAKTFQIRWEDGYVETFTFDFTKAELMGNLAEAVAPKSIAFNSPATQMVVGEEQELDLKMTKVQFNDVICISYKVSDETVLSVNDYGKITALKTGSATVTATPVKVVDGEKVAIKGAKTATVKVTVKPVTAPKVKKVVVLDNEARVQYTRVANGYRREIYVLEGKNVSTSKFEQKIKEMNHGQWEGIFAIAPKFMTPNDEYMEPYCVYNKKGEIDRTICQVPMYGLKNNTDYTVYVRNVSAVRKAENGNNVTLSAPGAVKGFKTTKAQIEYLWAGVKGAPIIEGTEGYFYEVKLSAGKVSMEAEGCFEAKELDASMDKGDVEWEKLPLSAALKKTYVDPKLEYKVYEKVWFYDEEIGDYKEGYIFDTKLASVDKKGNVKLKGVGTVYIQVRDTNTGNWEEVELHITASPDKVTGGKKKLSVGERVSLESLLTYYEGKKKLIGDYEASVIMDDALIQAFEENEAFALDEYGYVTAVKESDKPLDVTLTDYYVEQNEGQASAKVTLTTTALAPVKNLKLVNTKNLDWSSAAVAHNYAYVQFNYEGTANAFKVEITDERGRLIRSSYVAKSSLNEGVGKDKKTYYAWPITNLTQQSKYNVTVTARYGECAAKAAKIAIKTTKLPASTIRVLDNGSNSLDIHVMNGYSGTINDSTRLTSGNAYTLTVREEVLAASTGSDSLIWTSSNAKVASVKPVSGGFDAAFKALRAGTTVIEVKSKITKEVIARQFMTVYPVGDAYEIGKRYYDENTPDGMDSVENISNVELKVNNWTYVTVGKEAWIAYTAVKDGIYNFQLNDNYSKGLEVYDDLNKEPIAVNDGVNTRVYLTAKQPVYIKLVNTAGKQKIGVMVTVSAINVLDPVRGLKVQGNNSTVTSSFTAQEDGVYELKAIGADSSNFRLYDDPSLSSSIASGNNNILFDVEKGQTIYFKVYGRINASSSRTFKVTVSKFQPKQLTLDKESIVQTEKGGTEWMIFTAPETNVYTFTSKKNSNVNNYVTLHESVTESSVNSIWGDNSCEYQMQAGDKIYLQVKGSNSNSKADATITVSKLPILALDKKETVEVKDYNAQWYVFTAAEDSLYMFSANPTDENKGSQLYLYQNKNGGSLIHESNYNGNTDLLYRVEAGQTLYVKVNLYYGGTASLQVSVTKVVTETMEANKDIAVSLAENAAKFYEFTVPANGVYTFTTAPNAANDAADAQVKVTSNKNTEFELTADAQTRTKDVILVAGEIITLQVTNNDAPSAFVLNVTKKTIPAFTETHSAELATEDAWASFTAPENGTYIFRTVYEENAYDAYNYFDYYVVNAQGVKSEATSINSSFYSLLDSRIVMKAGETIFWKATDAETYPVSLQVEKRISTAEELVLNYGARVILPAGEDKWFEFTAPVSGNYSFYGTSENYIDSQAWLYESTDESNQLAYDDQSNDNGHFRINYDLTEGECVYLKVNHYFGEAMDIMVYVTQN